MVKEKLTGKYTATLQKVELHEVPSVEKVCSGAKLRYRDEVKWNPSPNTLKVEFSRVVGFEPEAVFSIVVSYYVEYELTEENALQDISAEQLKEEICSDLSYYLQEKEGFLSRVSKIIADLTSSFGGVPVILPPVLPSQKSLH